MPKQIHKQRQKQRRALPSVDAPESTSERSKAVTAQSEAVLRRIQEEIYLAE